MTGARPSLTEQEALANLLRTGRIGLRGSARVMRGLIEKGWAEYSVRTGKSAITDAGLVALRAAAAS